MTDRSIFLLYPFLVSPCKGLALLSSYVPEYDNIWRGDLEALSHVAGMFTAAPFVDVGMQRMMGHWAELHTLARAFYMKILAFVEECIVYRFSQSRL